MSLTLPAEQKLESAGLVALFIAHEADWKAAAQRTKSHLQQGFPKGAIVRQDDVAKVLVAIIEVDERLRSKLAEKKLTQNYWKTYFVDLIVERVWNDLT